MATNPLKLTKPQSQPSASPLPGPAQSGSNLLQLQHQISLELPKDRESVLSSKDTQSQSALPQAGIKKLAFLLDPRKDTPNSINSSHTSPKSFLGSGKSNKIKISTSLETSNLNLISPKDLVRLAMSKHKPKVSVKKISVQNSSSIPRNVRKSLGPGFLRSEKRDDSRSKIGSNSMLDDNGSKSSVPLYQDKSAKLKRMKLIYNDITQTEMARLTKSTVYTPQEASGRIWQGNLSPNRSNSGMLWTPNSTVVTASKGKAYPSQGAVGSLDKVFSAKDIDDNKEEKSYRKRASMEHAGALLKEPKPLSKEGKRQEKKSLQVRQIPSLDKPKTSVSFSRLTSSNVVMDHEIIERSKTPVVEIKEKKEPKEVLERQGASGVGVSKDVKPRDGFIADLKSWVNDIVKPQPSEEIIKPRNPVVTEKVKEVQEGLLEKLRETLDNDEFVRREDYERLYREKDEIEDELDAVKEENAQLRALLWKIKEEEEERVRREIEEKKEMKNRILASSYEPGLTSQVHESMARQNKELEMLRRRENVVKDLLKMIWKAGIEIGDLQQYEEMMNQDEEIEEKQEEYEQSNDLYSVENSYSVNSAQQEQGNQNYNYGKFGYGNAEDFDTNEKYKMHTIGESAYKQQTIYENESYMEGITEQKEDIEESNEASKPLCLSGMEDSEPELSNRQPQVALAKPTKVFSGNMVQKISPVGMMKSTADSSLLASAKPVTPLSCLQSRTPGKLKIDLSGVGGNIKSHGFSDQNSAGNGNLYIATDGGQSLGFHEEFMSKLDEFSPSWRQDALNYQKFNF